MFDPILISNYDSNLDHQLSVHATPLSIGKARIAGLPLDFDQAFVAFGQTPRPLAFSSDIAFNVCLSKTEGCPYMVLWPFDHSYVAFLQTSGAQ